ncbi:hypothetical protein [Vibrio sp. YT-19(2023)]|uniref:hypothetical protein n=1 Tax=Vibrio sp. YT-19(2023) TaxID=3074710 RepID=UPI00296472F2|nr:hypothetical protein [Vibrio sp. YT-19(2023)]MDW1498965.1 hypothetical protein [Vibrio sp. YT-19(2023)]
MSEQPIQLRPELAGNPYVTFDSYGNGVSRVFDLEWDFYALKQNKKIISFGNIDEKYRQDIQSYLYALMQWQKKESSSDSHATVGSLINIRARLNTLATRWGKSEFSLLSIEREWKKFTQTLHGVGRKTTCSHLAALLLNSMRRHGSPMLFSS